MAPPSLCIQPSSNQPEVATVEPTELSPGIECDEEEEAEEEPQKDEPLDDKEGDRVYQAEFNLVGRQVKALYSNSLFTGDVLYFNTALNEYKVQFDDGTTDYIDNVEILIVD